MYRTNRNAAIIQLILKIKSYDDEYPVGLYSSRRNYFVRLLDRILLFIMM